jgi:putative oxidoreductase
VARKVIDWVSTGLMGALSTFAGFAYLSGSREAVKAFANVGYPQQLRIILGLAKPLGAIALVVPGLRS